MNNFQKVNRNVNPIILKNGDGKNSLFIIQGTIKFPHSRLSSHSKKKFPHSRLRRSWGNFSLLFLLSLSWENIIVPFMIHREFLFPLLAPSAPRRGNIPSPFFKMMGLGQRRRIWKPFHRLVEVSWHHSCTNYQYCLANMYVHKSN